MQDQPMAASPVKATMAVEPAGIRLRNIIPLNLSHYFLRRVDQFAAKEAKWIILLRFPSC
jgi:hypothetical protein